jgi:hypothetical protein
MELAGFPPERCRLEGTFQSIDHDNPSPTYRLAAGQRDESSLALLGQHDPPIPRADIDQPGRHQLAHDAEIEFAAGAARAQFEQGGALGRRQGGCPFV